MKHAKAGLKARLYGLQERRGCRNVEADLQVRLAFRSA